MDHKINIWYTQKKSILHDWMTNDALLNQALKNQKSHIYRFDATTNN